LLEQRRLERLLFWPQVLAQYKPLIDEGLSMPLDQALRWEEAKAIESAKKAMAHMIASRKDEVLAKGRSEKGGS